MVDCVGVEREEVERQSPLAAAGEKRPPPALVEKRARRERRPAHLELRVVGLDCLRHLLVEREVFLLGALPHPAALGLVPDLPVFDAVLEAVGPAVVVVADDVHADPGELVHVGRRMVVVGGGRLDALAEPVDDLRAAVDEAFDVGIGLGERVVPRVVGIEVEERKDRGDIDDVGRRVVAVVEAGRRKPCLAKPWPQVGILTVGDRPVADAMERADGARRLREVHGDRVGRRCCHDPEADPRRGEGDELDEAMKSGR